MVSGGCWDFRQVEGVVGVAGALLLGLELHIAWSLVSVWSVKGSFGNKSRAQE